MFLRCIWAVSLMVQSLPLLAVSEKTQISALENDIHQDWLVELQQTVLDDTSTLSEYVARTNATTSDGSTFTVSFLPRFECKPVVSLIVGAASVQRLTDSQIDLDNTTLALAIDGESQALTVIGDRDGNRRRFTYNAPSTSQQTLREELDIGNRLQIQFTSVENLALPERADDSEPANSEEPAQTSTSDATMTNAEIAYTVSFSLLGSRRAVAMAEESCKHHEPIPFEQTN